ncbi:hypothetical protein FNF27_03300 [Cafeteria roenbergensis]|uniref:Vacuolar protein sorting-associated protein 45 n=1 Tax=Cafeteria roenbergensis TaxID=33653 RepID=A0A5A8CSX9_CAFRO|nr:hypothetical protein FNF31_06051 [Cafeteria roenbergensis]KAA0175292.1 hypothetical protein FNF27_03300 [Cafeteria roenbergensis]
MAYAAAAASGAGGARPGPGPNQPDVIKAVRHYVDKMIPAKGRTGGVEGMKVLLLDNETKGMVSMAIGMAEILEREVFFVGTIDRERDAMPHMKAIVFCRANSANLRLLADELKTPKHSQYHIFLSNIAPPSFLDQLAKADVHSRVEQVREYYADYSAVAPELFSLNLRSASLMCKPAAGPYGSLTMEEATFQRSLDGVMSVLLAHKLRPAIRFQGTSPLAGHFARAVDSSIGSQRELFGLMPHSSPSPLLLVLDRKEDPVTPLLTQWTYQAMVHETIGLWSNKVDLPPSTSGAAGQKVVLDPVHDDFFAEHMYSHFTVFAEAVQARLKEYEAKHKTTGSISSIEDMRRALERLPALRRARDNVSKHVAIMSELDRRVRNHKLFELTVLEQDLAEQDALSRHFEEVSALIADPAVRAFDALRLVMIFALRYEVDGSRQVSELKVALASRGIEHGSVALVDALLEYAGVRARGGDLFSKKSVIARVRRGVSRSLKGIDSAITNHKPLLSDILADLASGRLSTTLYPAAGKAEGAGPAGTVIIFVVGGVTCEEAAAVHKFNTTPGATMRVILGGTSLHNSASFIADVEAFSKAGAAGLGTPGPAAGAAASTDRASAGISIDVGTLGFGSGGVAPRGGSSYGTLS